MPESPPPSYSPRRPPPPYEEQNSRNSHKEQCTMSTEHAYKVSPPPFVPLSSPAAIDVDQLVIGNANMGEAVQPATIVIVHEPKPAPTFAPYETYCHKCMKNVTTRPHYVTGTLTWIVFALVFIFFLPLAFVPFCLDSCKDAHHLCPKCSTLLSIKKRLF
ncbi:unnamed protein product [Caenorhabditis auriculariae]|uniref:LITAF domain-containing protein n=1 Tax=Caenorhabditis auriculariae TaxID=2777116 RepID=A0A8S1GVU3_9PELO|nr:unnamed protein product [Caenorhabditis auriculariae]